MLRAFWGGSREEGGDEGGSREAGGDEGGSIEEGGYEGGPRKEEKEEEAEEAEILQEKEGMLIINAHIVRHYMFCLSKGKLNILNCKPNLLQIRFNVGIINEIHEAKKISLIDAVVNEIWAI